MQGDNLSSVPTVREIDSSHLADLWSRLKLASSWPELLVNSCGTKVSASGIMFTVSLVSILPLHRGYVLNCIAGFDMSAMRPTRCQDGLIEIVKPEEICTSETIVKVGVTAIIALPIG